MYRHVIVSIYAVPCTNASHPKRDSVSTSHISLLSSLQKNTKAERTPPSRIIRLKCKPKIESPKNEMYTQHRPAGFLEALPHFRAR